MRTQARREQAHRQRRSPRRWPLLTLPALGLITVVAATSMGSARNGQLGPVPRGPTSPGTASPTVHLQAGVTDVTIRSAALDRDMPAQVFLPRQPAPPVGYPVLYLFHGRYGTERGWMEGSFGREGVGVHEIAQELIDQGRIPPLVIVSALINDSYGVDSPPSGEGYDHGPYERYIMDELIPDIEARLPISSDPADRAIGGLSPGSSRAPPSWPIGYRLARTGDLAGHPRRPRHADLAAPGSAHAPRAVRRPVISSGAGLARNEAKSARS